MKLEDKIIWPFIVFAISILIIELIFFNFINITKANYDEIINKDTRFSTDEQLLIHYDLIREASFANYLSTNNQEYMDRYNTYKTKAIESFESIIAENNNPTQVEHYKKQLLKLNEILNFQTAILKENLPVDTVTSTEYLTLKDDYDNSRDLPKEYYRVNVRQNMVDNINKATLYSVIMIVIVFLVAFLVMSEFIVVKRDIINPLKLITKGIDNIKEQRFTTISVKSNTEMGQLAQKVNTTSIDLAKFSNNFKNQVNELQSMLKLSMLKADKGEQKSRQGRQVKKLRAEVENLQHMLKLSMVMLKNTPEKTQKTVKNAKNK